jgi:hypothetical protein
MAWPEHDPTPKGTMGVSWPPPAENRNLLNPYLPGTKEFTNALAQNLESSVQKLSIPPERLLAIAAAQGDPQANALLAQGSIRAPRVWDNPADIAMAAFTAYHGTPHKFDKFDVSKIGTGQGAASYGHGLYFAENPAVAGSYKKMLSAEDVRIYGKRSVEWPVSNDVKNLILENNGNLSSAILRAEKLSQSESLALRDSAKSALDELKALQKNNAVTVNEGALIKADIKPSPDKFLDWDKPLSEQPKSVLDPLRKAGLIDEDGYVGTIAGAQHIDDVTGDFLHQIIKEQYVNKYGEKELLSIKAKNADEAVSKYLNDLGIPGIRYLDQGSRPARSAISIEEEIVLAKRMIDKTKDEPMFMGGTLHDRYRGEIEALQEELKKVKAHKGTYNYVVFDDKDVEIVK